MCGIAGILNLVEPRPIDPGDLSRMMAAVSHRGPDGAGAYLDDWAGLAHTRLSIIDLAGGAQPITNEDGTLWIVYNGEVFNHPELREDLLSRGHRFSTRTDTEVILHLFEEKGERSLDEMNGQFALAIWDSSRRELFLARDRMGILPLHYAIHGSRFFFASEIKALFAIPGVPRALSPEGLDQIFTFWTTLPGHTAFTGVRELPAGHLLRISRGAPRLKRYWDVPFGGGETAPFASPDEAAEAIAALLRDAVSIRLRADVPVGSYLSGGLDSSGIASLARDAVGPHLRTFGIRFQEAPFDEGPYQKLMVSRLGVEHAELLASNAALGAIFSQALWHMEKPVLRTAPLPLFLLSARVRQEGLKVVLTGEGADEIFAGYDIFREAKVRSFWARRPQSRLRPLLLRRLYPEIFRDPRLAEVLGSFFGRGLDRREDPFFSHLLRWENTRRIKTFFSGDLMERLKGYDGILDLRGLLPGDFGKWDLLSRAQYLEMGLFLQGYLLSSQGDRVAMAHSLELRPPYLDHRVVELMARIPPPWRMAGMREKAVLKKALAPLVPPEICHRPKHPFRAPIRSTLDDPGPESRQELLEEGRLREAGLFDPRKVALLRTKLKKTPIPNEVDQMALAGILSTQIIGGLFLSPGPLPIPGLLSPVPVLFDRRSGRPGNPGPPFTTRGDDAP